MLAPYKGCDLVRNLLWGDIVSQKIIPRRDVLLGIISWETISREGARRSRSASTTCAAPS